MYIIAVLRQGVNYATYHLSEFVQIDKSDDTLLKSGYLQKMTVTLLSSIMGNIFHRQALV